MVNAWRKVGQKWGALLLVLLLLGGCDGRLASSQIDVAWHRQELDMHFSRWLAVAPTPEGFFRVAFNADWQALPGGDATELTGQARLLYVMIRGYEYTGDARYREAALKGGDFLLRSFHDPVHGGFFEKVDRQGRVVRDSKRLYGHAFALLALSHLARVTGEARYRDAALSTWQEIHQNFRDVDGGYRPEAPRNFGQTNSARTQNPVMHLFEALLALVEATNDEKARNGARIVADFVLYKLMQGHADGSAAIPEWYDAHWKPLPTAEAGGYIDIGHQFEWVHLLLLADQLGVSSMAGPAAQRILKYALSVGYDDLDGGVFFSQTPEGKVDRSKFWWQQAEGIHATLVAAASTERKDLWRRYEQLVGLVKGEVVDVAGGGWRFASRLTCQQRGCGTEKIEPYHMVSLHMAALALAKTGP